LKLEDDSNCETELFVGLHVISTTITLTVDEV